MTPVRATSSDLLTMRGHPLCVGVRAEGCDASPLTLFGRCGQRCLVTGWQRQLRNVEEEQMPNRAKPWITAVMLTVGIVISACGGEDSSSSSPASEAATTTGSPDEQLCEDREALEDSIETLAGVDVVAEGTSGVEEAVSDVQDSVGALSSSAAENFQPEVDATRGALEELEIALGDTESAGVTGVVSAIEDVVSSGDALLQSLQDVDCG